MPLLFEFHFTDWLVLRLVHFIYGNVAWGLHCGVDVKACLFWSDIDVIL